MGTYSCAQLRELYKYHELYDSFTRPPTRYGLHSLTLTQRAASASSLLLV